MKLSKLAYLCVKNVLFLNDPAFNEETFLQGDFDNDSDYATNINNVFTQINRAISLLSDNEVLPYEITEVKLKEGVLIDLKEFPKERPVKKVINVGQIIGGNPKKVEHRDYGVGKLLVAKFNPRYPLFVEYKVDIPSFDRMSIPHREYLTDLLTTKDVELAEEYGINETMCNYIIEFVQGVLLETVEPQLANAHRYRAENYINNMDKVMPAFSQRTITNKYTID